MDNIHAPTVPSGPASNTSMNGDLGRLSFAELQKKKENMEAELKALGAVLDSVCDFKIPCSSVPRRTWRSEYSADWRASTGLT